MPGLHTRPYALPTIDEWRGSQHVPPSQSQKGGVTGVNIVRPLVENLLTVLSRHTGQSERGQTLAEYGLLSLSSSFSWSSSRSSFSGPPLADCTHP